MGNPGPYVDVRITDFKKEAGMVGEGKENNIETENKRI